MVPSTRTELCHVLPSPYDLCQEIPLSGKLVSFVQRSRETLQKILKGQDERLLVIMGPCSIHDLNAAKEYAERFKNLAREVSDQFFLVMRTYFEKARTVLGWKGLIYDPDLDGSYNLAKGIRLARQFLVEMAEMGIPAASEMLEINTSSYYADCLSWGCIGARTTSSPPHRQLASGLPFAVGFKNTTDGNVDNCIRAILSASSPHIFLGLSNQGKLAKVFTTGNPHCHVVLRGSESRPNFHPQALQDAIDKCRSAGICERLIVDCSHGNCGKSHENQTTVFESIVSQVLEGNTRIGGIMLESYLLEGCQPLSSSLRYGVSITDPCLDWDTTEIVIRQAYSRLKAPSLCLV